MAKAVNRRPSSSAAAANRSPINAKINNPKRQRGNRPSYREVNGSTAALLERRRYALRAIGRSLRRHSSSGTLVLSKPLRSLLIYFAVVATGEVVSRSDPEFAWGVEELTCALMTISGVESRESVIMRSFVEIFPVRPSATNVMGTI